MEEMDVSRYFRGDGLRVSGRHANVGHRARAGEWLWRERKRGAGMEEKDAEKVKKYRTMLANAVMVAEDREEEVKGLKQTLSELRQELSAAHKHLEQYRKAVSFAWLASASDKRQLFQTLYACA
eukprot:Plantae.Rhodophyta-Purpureofilum_apyrenoidigerum.ctg2111.p2 GENE.Plantae.Rhodophyta-Purpureofilum_apyrenoidigerum.ctg2111~~Plantae.Rhodophyta-Purpureofilum_apyrenoidigerum.ctg2111.p2  ORF type:complete len:124 (-),score=27.90 Plantae.Rhodophyta-Purpureofilum_apyrenoidigerum.ctg2111:983-1354(-)